MLNISKSNLNLLDKSGYSFDCFEDPNNVTFYSQDGNSVQGLKLVEIVVTEILVELSEENSEFINDIDVFERFDYDVLCESPLEVISPDGEFVKGAFAKIIAEDLRQKLKRV